MTCRECGTECGGDLCGIHRPFGFDDITEDLICPGQLMWNEAQDGVLQMKEPAKDEEEAA